MTLEKRTNSIDTEKKPRKPRRAAFDVFLSNATKLPLTKKLSLIKALSESIEQEKKFLQEQLNLIENV